MKERLRGDQNTAGSRSIHNMEMSGAVLVLARFLTPGDSANQYRYSGACSAIRPRRSIRAVNLSSLTLRKSLTETPIATFPPCR
jgi:hypothetical protein